MGFWLMAAASAQVRASCMSDRLSFSVVAFAAQRRASSAYCRNWLAVVGWQGSMKPKGQGRVADLAFDDRPLDSIIGAGAFEVAD
jgi:hypothetical protein